MYVRLNLEEIEAAIVAYIAEQYELKPTSDKPTFVYRAYDSKIIQRADLDMSTVELVVDKEPTV